MDFSPKLSFDFAFIELNWLLNAVGSQVISAVGSFKEEGMVEYSNPVSNNQFDFEYSILNVTIHARWYVSERLHNKL